MCNFMTIGIVDKVNIWGGFGDPRSAMNVPIDKEKISTADDIVLVSTAIICSVNKQCNMITGYKEWDRIGDADKINNNYHERRGRRRCNYGDDDGDDDDDNQMPNIVTTANDDETYAMVRTEVVVVVYYMYYYYNIIIIIILLLLFIIRLYCHYSMRTFWQRRSSPSSSYSHAVVAVVGDGCCGRPRSR